MSNADKAKLETGKSKVETRNSKLVRCATALLARFSNFEFRFSDFAARVPWKLVLGAAGLFILAWAWREHDARLRRDLELEQLRQHTSAQVAALRTRADALLRAANEKNARVIRDLDSRRRQLERESEELRQRLLRLQEEEGKRLAEVASLPAAELAKRVADRLRARDSGFGIRGSGSEGQVSGVGGQVPETRDARLKSRDSGLETRDSGEYRREGPSPQPLAPSPSSSIPNPEFVLTEPGARQIETAFIELDSCRAQAAVKDGELANCQEQVSANRAIAGELNKSVNDLNQAIRVKDEILAQVQAEHQAELKAARGSRLGHFVRAVEYVGVGVVIGLVAR
jgi:uncharacterized protein YlxW (UPF0749 family)